MSQDFGIESHAKHVQTTHREPARLLVIIDSSGTSVARLFLATRVLVAEFDAGCEEVALMTRNLRPARGADGPEWDAALEGNNAQERRDADVYTLDI